MSTSTAESTDPATADTRTPAWQIVTLREITVKLRDKSFIVSTLITLALIIASIVVTGLLAERTTESSVAVVNNGRAQILVDAANQLAKEQEQKIILTVRPFDSGEVAAEALRAKSVDLVLMGTASGYDLTGLNDVPAEIEKLLSDAASTQALKLNAEKLGVTVASLEDGSAINTIFLEGSQERNSMALVMGLVFSMLFYMSALIFGMPIANSVVEEKQNRVVEILATAIPIRQLLAGKILGNMALAMGQLCLFVGIGLLALSLTPTEVPFLSLVFATSGWFLAFFMTGFLILAAVYAALGSMAARVEDLQQSTGPVIILLVAALFTGVYAKGSVLVIASYIPVISSVAMPIRLLASDVPLWEPIVSLLIAVAAAWAMVLLGERIYRRAIMQTGGALSWRKALKLED
ncbi:multidrug ABC transporter permease [Arthrobacter sp. MYb227]|uniref:ABC transporter permease n=1 Tax=Arthrobacter sp. MYb227 TaxID=1848601 RepID=UPI000CFAF6B1|nr:ABC transporter permease [Arthrobacter sp. MYb227]PQZ87013.1 multidrug ABC transporter permease [Arthrobacter sp. MYb227]